MKNFATVAALITIFITTMVAAAPDAVGEEVTAGPRVTLDPSVALPVGGLSDGAGFGFGSTAALRLPLSANIGLTGRAGFLFHLPKNDITTLALPLYVGGTYGFKPAVTTAYVALELGVVHLRQSGDGLPESASDTALGGTVGAGYRLSFADVRAGLQVYDVGDLGDSISLFATLAFRIAKF